VAITPEKSLVFSVLPLPSKVLLESPVAPARLNRRGGRKGAAVRLELTLPVLSIVLVLFCVAETFSTICTVSVSPTSRAR
jgi:hypothetical protein